MGRLSNIALPILGLSMSLGPAMGCSADVHVLKKLDFAPAQVSFGNVQIGTEATQVLIVSNSGSGAIVLEGVTASETLGGGFEFKLNRTTIVPGGTAELTATFAPEALGEKLGTITILSGDAQVPDVEIQVSGAGVTATLIVDAEVVAFGNVVINTTKSLPITLSNTSDVDANIELLEGQNVRRCSGANDPSTFCLLLADRAIGPDGRFSLGAGASVTLEVQFTPVIASTRERATVTFRVCGNSTCETVVRLEGAGIESGFRCDPPNLDFGQVNPGSCLSRTVSCENIANEQITVLGWGPSSDVGQETSADFTFAADRVLVLNEGDPVDVDVTYCPSALGNDEGYLQIETALTASNRLFLVGLTGTGGGPDIEVLPATCNFGLVSLLAPARCTVLVTNVGFDTLSISDISPDTAGTATFTAPGAGPVDIAPGGSYAITVEFQPLAAGRVESTLLIVSNDQDQAETEVRLIGEGYVLPPCDFEVAPAALSFGAVQVQRFQGAAFEIRNIGSNDCLVSSARLEPGTDPEFSMPDGDVRSQIIAPGSAFTIGVDYSPQALGNHNGGVEFSISSAVSPFNVVPLSGGSVEATLLIAPNELDFGTLGVGCATRPRIVQIYNTGSAPAVINSIQQAAPANAAFTLFQLPAPLPGMPTTIAPGQSVEFAVSFRADTISRYAGAVEISGTFEGSPVTHIVSMQGEGSLGATQEDTFEQLGTPKVDILFVIDFTGSMGQEQAGLSANFQSFIQFAQAHALDYQIGVTTTDSNDQAGRLMHTDRVRGNPFGGPFSNRIVTPSTQPNPETIFSQNVVARNLTGGGAADEAGLYAAYQALTPPVLTGHNAGFLRQDALLSLIFVSDEPEQTSTNIGAPANDVDFYVDFLRSIKGFRNANMVTASAIVGDSPSGCNGAGGSADAAPRYIEVANRTRGLFQSICTSDWPRALEDLSTTVFGFKTRFLLTNQPVVSTIVVVIDGVDVPATAASGAINWTYDFATNSVNFSLFSTPGPGSQISVRYTAECL